MTDARQHWDAKYKDRTIVEPLEFTKRVLHYVDEGARILDVGCGTGRDAAFFARNNLLVTAVDFSTEAIERVRAMGLPIDARVMETTSLNFPDTSFDAVYAHLSLHYFDDATTDVIFKSIHRMLKPSGHFFVRCKSTKDPLCGHGEKVGENIYRTSHVRHFFTTEYMREKLAEFVIVELGESSASFDGKESFFVDAVAQKQD
jgi:SAM-dependent methyltransferase